MASKERNILDTTSNWFEDWKTDFISQNEDNDIDISDFTDEDYWEHYNEEIRMWASDVKGELNIPMADGRIIAFANLEFWNGKFTGAKLFGGNINDIVNTCGCDYIRLYADRYNIKSELFHHDGTHSLTYRFVPYSKVNTIMELAERGELTWEYFRKNSKSIYKFIKEKFGW